MLVDPEQQKRGRMQSSFPTIHKLGYVRIFVLFKLENRLDVVVSHINFI